MYCLANMCYVCLEKENKSLMNINSSLSVNKDILHIIGDLPFNLAWMKTKRIILICEECCRRLRETYQLLAMCLKNSALLQNYMDQLNTGPVSTADNEAELRVYINNKHSEIKLEEAEIHTFESGSIIEESEEALVNVDDSFVKDEDTWKEDEIDAEDESSIDNNSTETSDEETDSEISVYSNTHDTNTDSDSSGFTRKQVHIANKNKINESGKKSYTCSTCSRALLTKFDLKQHTRVHTGDKPHECSDCDKCFISKSDLCRHKWVHTGAKPFKCSDCGKCFGRKHHLTIHMRVHTGEKPFKCSICEKCFSQTNSLANHIRVYR